MIVVDGREIISALIATDNIGKLQHLCTGASEREGVDRVNLHAKRVDGLVNGDKVVVQEKIVAFLKQVERGENPSGTVSMSELKEAAAAAKENFKRDDDLFTELKRKTKAESARLKDVVENLKLQKDIAAEALKQALDGEANPSDARKKAADAYRDSVRLEKEKLKEQLQALKENEKVDARRPQRTRPGKRRRRLRTSATLATTQSARSTCCGRSSLLSAKTNVVTPSTCFISTRAASVPKATRSGTYPRRTFNGLSNL
jgi:hypothetical protein